MCCLLLSIVSQPASHQVHAAGFLCPATTSLDVQYLPVIVLRCTATLHTVLHALQVLNESAAVVATLQHLHQLSPPMHEVIVVDGGSTDE